MCPKSSLAIDGIMDVYQFSTTLGEVDEMRDYVKDFFFLISLSQINFWIVSRQDWKIGLW